MIFWVCLIQWRKQPLRLIQSLWLKLYWLLVIWMTGALQIIWLGILRKMMCIWMFI
uniref:Uncharacterized protein n=1 Tax=Rhizophora mucronata TaxID=61149 RepID=A0A2P2PAK0_RHIMU